MAKNWLIRTKSNNIFGPVSKKKVLELLDNGSIKNDDEICSGNGFWFFIREKDLIEKYLIEEVEQGFNPVSEALSTIPDRDEDITLVQASGSNLLSALQEENESLAAQEVPPTPNLSQDLEGPKTSSGVKKKITHSQTQETMTKRNEKYFVYALIFLVLTLAGVIYYRKIILRNFFTASFSPNISLMGSAQAQVVKKKSFFTPI